MLNYQLLVEYLDKYYKNLLSIKNNYFVISMPNFDHHITVYEDQWNNYQELSGLPYYLFHMSSSDTTTTKCSIYFWVSKINGKILRIPKKFFTYGQNHYSHMGSTRPKCKFLKVVMLVKFFRRVIKDATYHYFGTLLY